MSEDEKLALIPPEKMPDFCIKVSFERGAERPDRLFQATATFIAALQAFDVVVVGAVDSRIETFLLLDEVESGSIRVLLRQALKAVPDTVLRELEWKTVVGECLVRAKYKALQYLETKETLDSREELEALASDISDIVAQSGALKFPVYKQVSASDLANGLRGLSEATKTLRDNERLSIELDEGSAGIGPGLAITEATIADLMTGSVITNTADRILMVHRPDFLGSAMWDFRHEKKKFQARMDAEEWLLQYQAGQIDVRPGDALKVQIEETTRYGTDGEVIGEERSVKKVLGVTRQRQHKIEIQ